MTGKLNLFSFFLILTLAELFSSCVVGFSNSQNHIPSLYSKIYVPSSTDSSVYSGNSSRLSYAIRNALAQRTDVKLTSLEDARVALQIKIADRKQSISTVDSCTNINGTATVGSGAFSCARIHPELTGGPSHAPTSFNQPSTSPSTESLFLIVEAKAIDLNNGKVLWAKKYATGAISFNEIGDNGDTRTMTYMANKPALHGLRYQEAIDNAVQTFSNTIAADVQNALFASLPTN